MKYFTLGLGAFALMIGLMVAPSAFAKDYPAALAATSNISLVTEAHPANEMPAAPAAATVLAPTIDMIQPTNTVMLAVPSGAQVLSQTTAPVGITTQVSGYPAANAFSTNMTPAITGSVSGNMNSNPAPATPSYAPVSGTLSGGGAPVSYQAPVAQAPVYTYAAATPKTYTKQTIALIPESDMMPVAEQDAYRHQLGASVGGLDFNISLVAILLVIAAVLAAVVGYREYVARKQVLA